MDRARRGTGGRAASSTARGGEPTGEGVAWIE
jgi:hypothetical protein